MLYQVESVEYYFIIRNIFEDSLLVCTQHTIISLSLIFFFFVLKRFNLTVAHSHFTEYISNSSLLLRPNAMVERLTFLLHIFHIFILLC
jgi:hypothetical protein